MKASVRVCVLSFFRRAYRSEGWASSKIPVYHAIKDAMQHIRAGSLPVSEPSPGTFVENARRYLQPHEYSASGVDRQVTGEHLCLMGMFTYGRVVLIHGVSRVGITLHIFTMRSYLGSGV